MKHCLALLMLLAAISAQAAVTCSQEWTFETEAKVAAWRHHVNMVKDVRCENGVMKGVISDWDPWLTSPDINIKATPWQYIEVELKTTLAGSGQIFFTNTNESPYNGFFSDVFTSFRITGDNQWHTYTIRPFWNYDKLLKIRLDLATSHAAEDKGKHTFEVRSIRIMDPNFDHLPVCTPNWTFSQNANNWQPLADCQTRMTADGLAVSGSQQATVVGAEIHDIKFSPESYGCWAVLEFAATGDNRATVSWFSETSRGNAGKAFDIIPDGKPHFYNVDLADAKSWGGDVFSLAVSLQNLQKDATLCLKSIRISDDPGGPANIMISHTGLTDALNRAGQTKNFSYRLLNCGGQTATNLHIGKLVFPEGITPVNGPDYPPKPFDLTPFEEHIITFPVTASKPAKGDFQLTLAFNGGSQTTTGPIEFTAPLNLPKYDYVPEPQPPACDYEIGALYFPGWGKGKHWGWQRIYNRCPERKPVLGWFDECNPACVDWQIKWLTENGIQYLLVDWYWNKGHIGLDHWLKAYYQCRYRKYLKWAMMWANHNPAGSHSVEDMEKVTRFWIDNYFNTPEYYKIDGKPVVMIWSVSNMDRDVKDGGAKKLLEVSNRIAREAGLPGIHFSAMKWPEATVTKPQIQALADKGFDSTSIYHYMGHGGKAQNGRRFSFQLVADSNRELWEKWYETGIIPFFTNLSTGWDDRPWNGGCEIYGRSPELFRKICQDAKAFADRTGLKKRILLSPINEWGEGSYAEPNREFGFGMYEAVRDTFCKKPAGGWPVNYGPEDIGLPSFDDPDVGPQPANVLKGTAWDFNNNTPQGWLKTMGLSRFEAADGKLKLTTSHWDSAISINLPKIRAAKFQRLIVRMAVSPAPDGKDDTAQLFWQTPTAKISERLSISLKYKADGQFHDLVFELKDNPHYRGFLNQLRFDPITRADAKIDIDSIRFE